MEEFINGLLDEIDALKAYMETLDKSSKEYTEAVSNCVKLSNVASEAMEKANKLVLEDEKNKLESRKIDYDWKRFDIETKARKKEFKIRVVVDGISIVVPLGVYWMLILKGFKFEETGAITSSTMRNILNKINPFKKV